MIVTYFKINQSGFEYKQCHLSVYSFTERDKQPLQVTILFEYHPVIAQIKKKYMEKMHRIRLKSKIYDYKFLAIKEQVE